MSERPSLNNPGCRRALAGEYVLGTLQGAARRRFERLLAQSADLQLYVSEWEAALAPLAEEIEPVKPPKAVWQALEAQTGPARSRWWDSLAFWRSFGVVAAGLLVAVTLFFAMAPPRAPAGDYVFVIPGQAGQVRWVVTASAGARRLDIHPVEPPGLGPERLCRLWWYPDRGAPRSLAVLPEGTESVQVRLPKGVGERLWRDEMAVTIEPASRPVARGPAGEEVFRGRWAPMT